MFDLWTSDVHTSKPCLPTLKACVKFQYLLYPFSFTLAYYFGFEFSVHFQPLQFFSFNRYLSSVPSTILTILNPRESGMKSIKSLSSRIIYSRDCSHSFHALDVLNIFLLHFLQHFCVSGVWVSGGWYVWGVVWGRLSSCSRSTYWNAKVPALGHLCPSSVEGKIRLLAYLEDSENISIHI